jgi:1,4-dihydroxy-2-naphthoate polyprenyltransferase
MNLGAWILAARPKTLGAAVAPVIVGSAVACKFGAVSMDWLLFACTLLACMGLQVATNWFNDALDFQKGADTPARLGPQRVTASGLVTPRQVFTAAALMLLITTLLSVPLIQARGWPILAIGLPSLYFCYGYTGGPLPLAYRGLGELFVILFFGFVAVLGSTYVQCGQWLAQAWVAGLQIGCLSTVLIAVNNLRDAAEDSTTGKRTLAVRFGTGFARWEITLLVLGAFALGYYWVQQAAPRACYFSLIALPLGLRVVQQVWTREGKALNAVLAQAGACLLLFMIGFTVGLFYSPQ